MTFPLDLFSTSQTSTLVRTCGAKRKKDKRIYDECLNNAPYFAYKIQGRRYGVVQGCCNSWNCPRCGQQRAREEYGRIVVGAREIGRTHDLYMMTITCRGKDCTVEDAENNYLKWTNNLLTTIRTQNKRASKAWFYASVTERQKRKHPHSHYLTTYCPPDAIFIKKGEGKNYVTTGDIFQAKHNTLQSNYLECACVSSGLGNQYDISKLDTVEGASRYVAKYLFKETVFSTVWPKGWRRVRYSEYWPKLPEIEGDGFILLTDDDWLRLAREAHIIVTNDDGTKKVVKQFLRGDSIIIS